MEMIATVVKMRMISSSSLNPRTKNKSQDTGVEIYLGVICVASLTLQDLFYQPGKK